MRKIERRTVSREIQVETLHCERTGELLAEFEEGAPGELHAHGFELHLVAVTRADDGALVRLRNPEREPVVRCAGDVIEFVGAARLESLFPSLDFTNGTMTRRQVVVGAPMGQPIRRAVGPQIGSGS